MGSQNQSAFPLMCIAIVVLGKGLVQIVKPVHPFHHQYGYSAYFAYCCLMFLIFINMVIWVFFFQKHFSATVYSCQTKESSFSTSSQKSTKKTGVCDFSLNILTNVFVWCIIYKDTYVM